MKKINYKIIISASLLAAIVIVACSKSFLDHGPLGTLNPAIVANEKGVQGLLIGAYSLVDGEGAAGDGFASGASNWIFGGVSSDDAYKGSDPTDVGDAAPLENWTITPANGFMDQKWNACYAGAQRANEVLRIMASATDIGADEETQIKAQSRFLRAFYHFELKKIFGNIIFVDESVTKDSFNVTNSATDVWSKIEADLQFAAANLPETWGDDGKGRANSWAAKALLAKVYMYENKLSTAYPILKDIIANGKTAKGDNYALTPHYFSNFNPAQKNSTESVFAAQTSVQDNSSVDWGGDPNGNYGDILNFPYNGGPGACCGFDNPTQDLANAYKTNPTTGLPLLDGSDPLTNGSWTNKPWVSDQYGTSYTGTLDPRIDWVMGRPGIPYLDWGPHPGLAWIRNAANDGNKSPKKDVYASSQKGAYTDVGSAYWGPTELTANNVNIIRFSDVILWAAECAASAGDLPAATAYVNTVRSRIIDHPEAWVKTGTYDASGAQYTSGNNADNYKIGVYPTFPNQAYAVNAIRFERRLELAMEGQRFFDLVRWGIAPDVINAFIQREYTFRPLKAINNGGAPGHFTKGKNEVFPIPQSEIDQMNSDGTKRLTQNPNY